MTAVPGGVVEESSVLIWLSSALNAAVVGSIGAALAVEEEVAAKETLGIIRAIIATREKYDANFIISLYRIQENLKTQIYRNSI
jgi:hypothetical protein